MGHEDGLGGTSAAHIEESRRAVDETAGSRGEHSGILGDPGGVGHDGATDISEGREESDSSCPDVAASEGVSGDDSFEEGGDGEPAELDGGPGGLEVDAVVVVEVVHGEVHLGVSVAEDDLVHHQTVELLVGRGLETGDRKRVEDLSEETQVEAGQRHREGILGQGCVGDTESDDTRGNSVDVGDGAGGGGGRLGEHLCGEQQADE